MSDLAEWGLIDELSEYLMNEMVKLIEDSLPHQLNVKLLMDDDPVIQDAGEIPENSDFEGNPASSQVVAMPDSYFKGNASFKVP